MSKFLLFFAGISLNTFITYVVFFHPSYAQEQMVIAKTWGWLGWGFFALLMAYNFLIEIAQTDKKTT